MAQQPPNESPVYEQVMILVQHESYAQLVSPLPTGTMSYEKLEELLCLRDTVAYAARPREPGYVFYCDAILARSREYRADIAESRRQGWPKPWDASCRYQCVLPFVNQFKISRAHGYHPLGDLLLLPAPSKAVKAIVEYVVAKMFRSAISVAQLSKLLVVAWRDWDAWGRDMSNGGYYRARAVEAAVAYWRWVEGKQAERLAGRLPNMEFGDFPDSSPRALSLAHSVYFPRARSAQGRRAEAESAMERWGAV